MKIIKYFLLFFLIFFSFKAFPKSTLTEEEILKSSIKYYPKILSAIEGYRSSQGDLKSMRGAFDLNLNQDLSSTTAGFYDGRSADSRLEKNLPVLNSKIYTGYRISDGNFPIYEDKLITNSSGEFNIGFALSLLRGNTIDKKRLNLRNAELAVEERELELLLTKIFVQHKALKTYYNWLAANKKYEVYTELLTIAKKRQSALSEKVENGDLADIYLTENKQYILQREVLLNEASRDLKNKANELSLFFRDETSKPINIEGKYQSDFANITGNSIKYAEKNIADIKRKRPDLNIMSINIEKVRNKIKFAENLILPKIDLTTEASEDNGFGNPARDEFESVVKLNVSIPIQRNFAQGKIDSAKAKKKKYESDQKLISEQIDVEIKNIINDLKANLKYNQLTNDEVKVAIRMREAENEKFEKGISDFLLLNIREEKMASAKLKNIEAKLQYFYSLADFYAASVDTKKLGI